MSDDSSERLISALLEISNLVGSVMRIEDILARISHTAADLMNVPVCSIFILDDRRQLVMRSNVGLEPELVDRATFTWGSGIPGWVAKEGELVALPDATRDPRYEPLPSEKEQSCRACICAPLRIQEELIGVMYARSLTAVNFGSRQRLLFETICKMVAIVIEKARMHQEKIKAQELAAVAISLSEIAHYIKNVMFTTQVAESTVSHGIKGECDLKDVQPAWQSLKEANQRIRKLVSDMLNYCREEAPQYEKVDINEMIRQLASTLEPHASRTGVRIVTETEPGIPVAWLDPHAIYGALLNLATNAIDAIPKGRGGTVRIRTSRLDSQNNLRIDVADDGSGIPVAVREKIFTLFFTTKGKQGSGIGLAATRKVIEMHGGSIHLDSEVNRGSTFTVYLPIRPPTVQMSL